MQYFSEYKSLFLIFSVFVIFSFAEEVFAGHTAAKGYPSPYGTPYGTPYATPAYATPAYAYPTPAAGLGIPTNLKIKQNPSNENKATISWSAVPGAAYYSLRVDNNSSFTFLDPSNWKYNGGQASTDCNNDPAYDGSILSLDVYSSPLRSGVDHCGNLNTTSVEVELVASSKNRIWIYSRDSSDGWSPGYAFASIDATIAPPSPTIVSASCDASGNATVSWNPVPVPGGFDRHYSFRLDNGRNSWQYDFNNYRTNHDDCVFDPVDTNGVLSRASGAGTDYCGNITNTFWTGVINPSGTQTAWIHTKSRNFLTFGDVHESKIDFNCAVAPPYPTPATPPPYPTPATPPPYPTPATPPPTLTCSSPDNAPGNMMAYRGTNSTYQFKLTGTNGGVGWGTTLYTDDSHLSTMAVHSGVVPNNQSAIVNVTVQSGAFFYNGTPQNGVTTFNWGPWGGSYTISLQQLCSPPPPPPPPPLPPLPTPPVYAYPTPYGYPTPPPPPACSDGIDNDDDGLTDYTSDPGCSSVGDTSEADAVVNLTANPRLIIMGSNSGVLEWTTNGMDESLCTLTGGALTNPNTVLSADLTTLPGPFSEMDSGKFTSIMVNAKTTYTLRCGTSVDTATFEVDSVNFET